MVALLGACSGGGPAAPAATGTSSSTRTTAPAPPATGGSIAGSWHGTLSFSGVVDSDTTETSTSGDPGSLYTSTTTLHDVYHANGTDQLTVTGVDDGETEVYGVGTVELSGTATTQGSSMETHSAISDLHNALGCHFTDEIASETSGSVASDGTVSGTINFSDDGSYYIRVNVSPADPEGDGYETPQLPRRQWRTYTILDGAARDCPPPGTSEVKDTSGPLLWWVSGFGSGEIEGSIDPANPGSVIEGELTLPIDQFPPGSVTVSWHLEHDRPIIVNPPLPEPE